jgi:hypothetical protein
VHSREPLWVEAEPVLAATLGEPEPMHMPANSYWPLFTAVGITLTLVLFMAPSWWEPLIGLAWTFVGALNWAYEPT